MAQDGINNEKGLSALMDFPEIMDVLGEDIYFELKSMFTDALGGNLRNEVAHGLLELPMHQRFVHMQLAILELYGVMREFGNYRTLV